MSITHSWNGTVLTITSDSGTSSCDLKGDKGDDGVRGAQGACGEQYKPVKGLDYYTEEEINELTSKAISSLPYDDTLSVSGMVAEASTVGEALAQKADNSALELKANTEDVNSALDLKANSADVESALEEKVDKTLKINGKALQGNIDLTYENVGAAPANYTYPTVNGVNANAITDDYHRFVINCSNNPYAHGFLDVTRTSGAGFSPNGAIPIIHQTMREWSTGHKSYRASVDNGVTWGEWIDETPLMNLWTEYRTNKRWQGKRVYTKAINMSNFPVNSYKTSGFGANATSIMSLHGELYYNGEWIPFPVYLGGTLQAYLWTDGSSVGVTTLGDISSGNANIVIEYTKD